MNVLFLQRRRVSIFITLSLHLKLRGGVLRFYHLNQWPGRGDHPIASLVSGLSLARELRWYIRRYMQDVLFESRVNVYCTLALARQIYYDREIKPEEDWPFRRLYVIRKGTWYLGKAGIEQGFTGGAFSIIFPEHARFIVLCTERGISTRKIGHSGEGSGEPR